MAEDLKGIFDEMKKRYKAGSVAERTTFYFSLGDGPGQKWSMTMLPEACEVVEGKTDNADCVMKTSADLFVKIVTGKHSPGVGDFMMGRIKSNDPDKLRLLAKAFGPSERSS